jgi:hypothetical protein
MVILIYFFLQFPRKFREFVFPGLHKVTVHEEILWIGGSRALSLGNRTSVLFLSIELSWAGCIQGKIKDYILVGLACSCPEMPGRLGKKRRVRQRKSYRSG